LPTVEAPNVLGIPPDHPALDSARPGVPAVARMPTLFCNTQASHIL
jgi:hypothetical protein